MQAGGGQEAGWAGGGGGGTARGGVRQAIAAPPKNATSSVTFSTATASAAAAASEAPLLSEMGVAEGLAGAERVLERDRQGNKQYSKREFYGPTRPENNKASRPTDGSKGNFVYIFCLFDFL